MHCDLAVLRAADIDQVRNCVGVIHYAKIRDTDVTPRQWCKDSNVFDIQRRPIIVIAGNEWAAKKKQYEGLFHFEPVIRGRSLTKLLITCGALKEA
jgi:hypothetical protein